MSSDVNRGEGELDPEFERFVRRCSPSLLRTALLLTEDLGQAEDLLQVTLLRTARRWAKARESPDAYARRVLVNLSHDRHRQARRRVGEDPLDHAGSFPGLRDQVDVVLGRDAVVGALRRLPFRQREVVVLRFYVDLSIAETAKVMGSSEGTVKSYTARALIRLRELLTEPLQTIPEHTGEGSHDD
jgi:RNA polymerase sigma-70 factor (sigma-E family)